MIGVITAIFVLIVGAGEVVAGIYLLTGTAWALVAAGLFTLIGGVIVARGLSG